MNVKLQNGKSLSLSLSLSLGAKTEASPKERYTLTHSNGGLQHAVARPMLRRPNPQVMPSKHASRPPKRARS